MEIFGIEWYISPEAVVPLLSQCLSEADDANEIIPVFSLSAKCPLCQESVLVGANIRWEPDDGTAPGGYSRELLIQIYCPGCKRASWTLIRSGQLSEMVRPEWVEKARAIHQAYRPPDPFFMFKHALQHEIARVLLGLESGGG